MEKQLLTNSNVKKHNTVKLAKAVDYLNDVSYIFEQAGLTKEADEVLEILKSFVATQK